MKTIVAMKYACVGLALVVIGGCAKSYDAPEFVDVAANETAFVIKLDGQNNDANGQAQFQSEAYLQANRVAIKRIQVTHRWVDTGYGWGDGKYIPEQAVIKVDRSAVTRLWTKELNVGTSNKDEAVAIESKDSIGFSIGWTCTAYIQEEDAAKFLYLHPSGSLAQVMDTEVLGRIQKACQNAVNDLMLVDVPHHKADIQKAVEADIIPWFTARGLTISNVGMYGGLTYDNAHIQQTIDDAAAASNLSVVAQAKLDAQMKDNQRIELEAKGLAEAARLKAQGEADSKLLVAEAEAKGLVAVQDAMSKVANPEMVIEFRELDIRRTQAERWNGQYPMWYMAGGAGAPSMQLQVPVEDLPTGGKAQPARH